MATPKQIAANRRNAQKSTGPKTEQGKSKARFNALKHGMTAEAAVLPHEDKISYEELRRAAVESYQPANGAELMLVELVAINYWRLLRACRVETATMDLHIRAYKGRHGVSTLPGIDDDCGIATAFADPYNGLDNIQRYQTKAERSYFRAVEALRKAQNDRFRRERIQNGFVSQPQLPHADHNAVESARGSRDQKKNSLHHLGFVADRGGFQPTKSRSHVSAPLHSGRSGQALRPDDRHM